jgi:hypothetical protein
MERYRLLLANQGLSPEMFEANVRADLSNRQVTVRCWRQRLHFEFSG